MALDQIKSKYQTNGQQRIFAGNTSLHIIIWWGWLSKLWHFLYWIYHALSVFNDTMAEVVEIRSRQRKLPINPAQI